MDAIAEVWRLSAGNSYPRCWFFQARRQSRTKYLVLSKAGVESTTRPDQQSECEDWRIYWVIKPASVLYDLPVIAFPHSFVTSRRPTTVPFILQCPRSNRLNRLASSIYICCSPLQQAYLLAPPTTATSLGMAATSEVISKQYVPLTCHGHSRPVTHLSFSGIVGNTEEEYYLISACKDNNPMLRDGITGDWIGTFFGHKGAVYQARLSPDAIYAATASADFTARVWDTHTGETLWTLQHNHIVRAVAFPPGSSNLLATGGMEKKLRIFELPSIPPPIPGASSAGTEPTIISADQAFEIGPGIHQGNIKAIVWTRDPNILVTAADDKMIRWWDLQSRSVVKEQPVSGDIGSCEFTAPGAVTDIGGGLPVLTIAAGKTVYFYGGQNTSTLLKSIELPYEVASVALHAGQRKFVTGGTKDTWAKVYNYDTEEEIDVHKGHHGPIWSISFSPDGKLYATGSEDGTIKMWKNCQGSFGLWRAD